MITTDWAWCTTAHDPLLCGDWGPVPCMTIRHHCTTALLRPHSSFRPSVTSVRLCFLFELANVNVWFFKWFSYSAGDSAASVVTLVNRRNAGLIVLTIEKISNEKYRFRDTHLGFRVAGGGRWRYRGESERETDDRLWNSLGRGNRETGDKLHVWNSLGRLRTREWAGVRVRER